MCFGDTYDNAWFLILALQSGIFPKDDLELQEALTIEPQLTTWKETIPHYTMSQAPFPSIIKYVIFP